MGVLQNDFTKAIGIVRPLIVAPMAGGPSSPGLVSESSRAQALGSIGAAYMNPDEIESFANMVRAKTDRPFAVNLFIPTETPAPDQVQIERALAATAKYRQDLDLPTPQLIQPFEENFDNQFEKILSIKPRVLSFVFGVLKPQHVQAARDRGIYLIGTATDVEEALALQSSGVDAITVQGIEAGGHRGIFNPMAKDPEIKILDLLRRCAKRIQVPLIAAGGIMNREHALSALSLGAAAVQVGTAFLNCPEAGTSKPYREALMSQTKRETQTTRVFSGRWARGIKNRFLTEMEKHPEAILSFPAQNKFTRDLRAASASKGSPDFLSLWCGTGEGALSTQSARKIILDFFP